MTGVELIAAERKRQVEKEGWTQEHDASHTDMTLAVAGAAYALDIAGFYSGECDSWRQIYCANAAKVWPFDLEWFKSTHDDPVRQLVKAGALIAAEIDRIKAT